MKHNKGFASVGTLLIVLGLVVIGGAAYFVEKYPTQKKEVVDISGVQQTPVQEKREDTTPVPKSNPAPTASKEERFVGTVTNVEVWADGPSYIFVDGKKILTSATDIMGSNMGVFGKAPYPSTSLIGSRVKVFAQKNGNEYTLYGNANYYVEAL